MMVFWTENAKSELLEIRDYLDGRHAGVARALIEQIRARLRPCC